MNYLIDKNKLCALENTMNENLNIYKKQLLSIQKANASDYENFNNFKEYVLKDYINTLLDIFIVLGIDYKIENDILTIDKNKDYFINDENLVKLKIVSQKISDEKENLVARYKNTVKSDLNFREELQLDIYIQQTFYKHLGFLCFYDLLDLRHIINNNKASANKLDLTEEIKETQAVLEKREKVIISKISILKDLEDINEEIILEEKRLRILKSNKEIYSEDSYQEQINKILKISQEVQDQTKEIIRKYEEKTNESHDLIMKTIDLINNDLNDYFIENEA